MSRSLAREARRVPSTNEATVFGQATPKVCPGMCIQISDSNRQVFTNTSTGQPNLCIRCQAKMAVRPRFGRPLQTTSQRARPARLKIFAIVYRRLVPCLGHAQAIGAIAHRLCRLIWKILHQGIRYEERGPAVSNEATKVRARKMIRELRSLGYRVELAPAAPTA
jgi:hypothetical protein